MIIILIILNNTNNNTIYNINKINKNKNCCDRINEFFCKKDTTITELH